MLAALLADPVAAAAVTLVSVLVVTRLSAGSDLLAIRFVTFWGTARRIYMPLLDRVGTQTVGIGAENRALRQEFVADVAAPVTDVVAALDAAGDSRYEVSVLSGLKSDWAGNTEVASVVSYAGPKPIPAAPDWLRPDQVHVFLFRPDHGPERTRVCAHYEANSWRPDRWKDHLYKGETYDAAKGVRQVRGELATEGLVFPGPGDDDTPDVVTGE